MEELHGLACVLPGSPRLPVSIRPPTEALFKQQDTAALA